MAKAWKDVIASDAYRALPAQEQAKAQQQYFDEVVAPRVPDGNIEGARAQFFGQYPLPTPATQVPQTPTEGPTAGHGPARGWFTPDGGYHIEMSHEGPGDAQDSITPPAPPATQSSAAPAAPSVSGPNLSDSLLRSLGLTARAGMTGLGDVADIFTEPIRYGMWKAGIHDAEPTSDVAASLADALGLPRPEGRTEREVQDVAKSVAGVMTTGGIARQVANKIATPLAEQVGKLFGRNLGTQAASVAAGSGVSSFAKEGGSSPGEQAALGAVASLAPTALPTLAAGAVRSAIRGGEAGRLAMAERAQQFKNATGVSPTVGQATGRTILQGIENQVAKTLGGVGVMRRNTQRQIDALRGKVEGVARGLSPAAGAVEAGESVANGLQGFKEGFRNLQSHLYDVLDRHIAPTAQIRVSHTQDALRALTADIDVAESVSRLFKNAKIGGLMQALNRDLEKSAQSQIKPGFSMIMHQEPDLSKATLPYQSIKKLRTLVGEELANQSFMSDVPRSKWKALYAALTEDLGEAAAQAGPDAQQAWRWANTFTRQQMARLDDLAGVMNKDGPEKIFAAAMSGNKEGNTMLDRVVSALPKQSRRDVAAAVLRRMGRAKPGQQNELGDAFSPETFLTNWAAMSPEAKRTLFGRLGIPDIETDLVRLTRAANMMRESSRAFANPSGTGADIRLAAQLGGGGLALASGNLLPAAIVLGGAPLAASTAARLTTNPSVVRWLTQTTEANPATAAILGNIISRLP